MRENNTKKDATKETILIGPDCIEFGWKMMFQGAARKAARDYKNVIVVCEPGFSIFYKDFADKIIEQEYKCALRDRYLYKATYPKVSGLIKNLYPGASSFSPNKKTCKPNGEFIQFGTFKESLAYDIVLHARAEDRYKSKKRNWKPSLYEKLVKHGKRVCSIGSKLSAAYIKGTDDLRGVPLETLCNVMASSQVGVGTSSGPMHLMSMCGLPHIVMSGSESHKSIGYRTNKERYKKFWNPLKTKCAVIDEFGWTPPVKEVEKVLKRYL